MSVLFSFRRPFSGRAGVPGRHAQRPSPMRGRSIRVRLSTQRASLVGGAISAVVVAGGMMFASAPAAQALGVQSFFAANCNAEHSTCGEDASHPSESQAATELFTQAGGYVPYGITDFKINTEESEGVLFPEGYLYSEGYASVRNVRVDVSPGVVTNPEAVPQCSRKEFEATEETVDGLETYTPSTCSAQSIIAKNRVLTVVPTGLPHPYPAYADVPLEGDVYNVTPPNGDGLLFGVALSAGDLGVAFQGVYFHTLIEGSVEWATNYHDYFIIKNLTPGVIESRLTFRGNTEEGGAEGSSGFIRNPSACVAAGPATTTGLKLESYLTQVASAQYTASLGTGNCGVEAFVPSLLITPETSQADSTDGVSVEAKLPQRKSDFLEPGTSDVKEAVVTLPKGMTLNPSAANGLTACTQAQFGLGIAESRAFEIRPISNVSCPSTSKVGTVSLEVPTLPAHALEGSVFLGGEGPAGEKTTSISKPPYTIYLNAESTRYGIQVRAQGTVAANPETGQLTATIKNTPGASFESLPEAPFKSLTMQFNGGEHAPIANPLTCGAAEASAVFTPFASQEVAPGKIAPAVANPLSAFTVEACASPQFTSPPLGQSASVSPNTAAATSNLTFAFARPEGEQYVQQLTAALPPGLVAKIPSVPLCGEAQANAGTCPAASLIGTVRVSAGSGGAYAFTGNVYLTEHYDGAPYGLSAVVSTAAGPFNFGQLVARAKIEINQLTAQVVVAVVKTYVGGGEVSGLPTIVGGIPIRMREMALSINRPNYLINPTDCGTLEGSTSIVSTLGSTATVTSPLTVEGCSSLAFKPSFSAATNANTSRHNGAALTVKIAQGSGQANIKSTITTLPRQLPSRLETLNHACTEKQAAENILACPARSKVGKVTAVSPTLPGTLSGPAYIVSQGGKAFPNLDLVLDGDGVQIILVGNTKIVGDVTTTTFANNPDVPVSSILLTLPTASNSLLSANGSLCLVGLYMPTTLIAQSGKQIKQQTRLSVSNCLPIKQHRSSGHRAIIKVHVPQAGKITVSGGDLVTATAHPSKANTVTISVPLSSGGLHALSSHQKLGVTLHVAFKPRKAGGASFTSSAKVTFKG